MGAAGVATAHPARRSGRIAEVREEEGVPVREQDPEKGGFQGNEVIRKDETRSSSEWVSRQTDDGLAKDQRVTAMGCLRGCSRGPHCAG